MLRKRLSNWFFGTGPRPSRKVWLWFAAIIGGLSAITGLDAAAGIYHSQIAHGTQPLSALGAAIVGVVLMTMLWLFMGGIVLLYAYKLIPELWQMLQELWRGICMIPDAVRTCGRGLAACGRALRSAWQFLARAPAAIRSGINRWRALKRGEKLLTFVALLAALEAIAVYAGAWFAAAWLYPHLPHWLQFSRFEQQLIMALFIAIIPLSIVITVTGEIGRAVVRRLKD